MNVELVRAETLLSRVPMNANEEIASLAERLRAQVTLKFSERDAQRLVLSADAPTTFATKRAMLNADVAFAIMTPEDDDEFRKRARHFDLEFSKKKYSDAEYDRSIYCDVQPLPVRSRESDVMEETHKIRESLRLNHANIGEYSEFRHMTAMLVCEVVVLMEELQTSLEKGYSLRHQQQLVVNALVYARTFLKNEGLIRE